MCRKFQNYLTILKLFFFEKNSMLQVYWFNHPYNSDAWSCSKTFPNFVIILSLKFKNAIARKCKKWVLEQINSMKLFAYEFFSKFFLRFRKYHFRKKCKAPTVKLLIQSPGKFLSVMWNVTKIYPKFVTSFIF